MSVLEQITAHYAANQKQSIDVPEWGADGQPLRIFWQLLTVERRKALAPVGADRDDVDVLVAMAEDADGKKLFDLGAKPLLRLKADAAIVSRVVSGMLGLGRLTEAMVEQAAKN